VLADPGVQGQGASQGLARKRKIAPRFTASMAVAWSALPVSMIRVVSGQSSRAWLSSSTPSIPGMRWSETMTA